MSNKTHYVLAGAAAFTFGLASMTLSGQSFGAPPHPNQPKTASPAMSSPAPAMQTMQKLTKSQIKSVQEALNKAGYHVKADGVWGKGSSSVLKMFQTKHSLPATGYPDQKTRQALGLSW
ncbi:MAG: peptidoglycan-binding domain-containing protein [Gammaproteobacteria bacterium]